MDTPRGLQPRVGWDKKRKVVSGKDAQSSGGGGCLSAGKGVGHLGCASMVSFCPSWFRAEGARSKLCVLKAI